MPIYEYRCPTCDVKFELMRPMSRADEPASCPHGHGEARRLVSVFASFTRDASGDMEPIAGSGPSCAGCTGADCSACF